MCLSPVTSLNVYGNICLYLFSRELVKLLKSLQTNVWKIKNSTRRLPAQDMKPEYVLVRPPRTKNKNRLNKYKAHLCVYFPPLLQHDLSVRCTYLE